MELLFHGQFSLPPAGPRGVFVIHRVALRLKWVCSRVQVDLEHGESIPDWLQPRDMNSLWSSPAGNSGTFWRVFKQALNHSRLQGDVMVGLMSSLSSGWSGKSSSLEEPAFQNLLYFSSLSFNSFLSDCNTPGYLARRTPPCGVLIAEAFSSPSALNFRGI